MSVYKDSFQDQLSPEDKKFDQKIKELWLILPTPLFLLLMMTLLNEPYLPKKVETISSTIQHAFVGAANDNNLAPPLPTGTLNDLNSSETSNNVEVERISDDFYEDQRVIVEVNNREKEGTISQLHYLTDTEGTHISFVIVDYADGGWGGFNPQQIQVIPDAHSVQ